MDLIRARGRGVPRGGTAKFRLSRLRVYTVLPFCFSCGEVGIRFADTGLRAAAGHNNRIVFWVNDENRLLGRNWRWLGVKIELGCKSQEVGRNWLELVDQHWH